MADREKRMRQLAWVGAAFIAASAIFRLKPPTNGVVAAIGILLTIPYFYDEYGDRIRSRFGSK